MAANITSGIIGDDSSDDDQWKMSWIARLAETEEFVYRMINSEDSPFTLFYSTGIERGTIDSQSAGINLSIPINMRADIIWIDSVQRAVQVVYDGLNATGRKSDWELSTWPRQSVTGEDPITMQNRFSRNVEFELQNENGVIIGTRTVNLRPLFNFFRTRNDRIIINYNENNFSLVIINAVRINDVSDNITIRAVPENYGLRITALSEQSWLLGQLRIENGIARGFDRSQTGIQALQNQVLDLTGDIWGEPNGITSIGDLAFSGNQLAGVIIPNTVTAIGNGAFENNRMTSVIIPDSVIHLGSGAFARNQLTSVSIGNNVTSIRDRAFYGNRLAYVNIPERVSFIGNGAFENNQLRSVSLPGSLTSIGDWAFSRNQLSSVNLPERVAFIGSWAFSGNLLSSVNIPGSLTSINDGVFYDNQLLRITIPESVTSIGLAAFRNNQIIESTIGASIDISSNAFDNRFVDFYNTQGRSAGTYNWENRQWNLR